MDYLLTSFCHVMWNQYLIQTCKLSTQHYNAKYFSEMMMK